MWHCQVHALLLLLLMPGTEPDVSAAAGEAFDKVARMLGLDMRPSGGAAVEALALEGDAQRFKFSVPLQRRNNCNFSYAGLKTAVRLACEAEMPEGPTPANRQVGYCASFNLALRWHVPARKCMPSALQVCADIAASFQRVAIMHLAERCRRGCRQVAAIHK